MRIYILANSTVKKGILPKLEPYLHDVRRVSYIWSVNGLLQLENNKIYQVKIKDVLAKKTLLGAYPVTIDESEFIRQEEEWFQITPKSYREYTMLKAYRLPEQATALEWIFEYKDDELHDNYFTLPNGEDIHSPKIKAELLQFLNI
jgi:hypothetical protein